MSLFYVAVLACTIAFIGVFSFILGVWYQLVHQMVYKAILRSSQRFAAQQLAIAQKQYAERMQSKRNAIAASDLPIAGKDDQADLDTFEESIVQAGILPREVLDQVRDKVRKR